MKLSVLTALLLASFAARAEDVRIEAVRADAAAADQELGDARTDNRLAATRIDPAQQPVADKTMTMGDAPYAPRDSHLKLQFGAMIGLVSLPRPMDAEIFVRVSDLVSVGFSYSDFPAFVADPLLSAAGLKSGPTVARLDQFNSMELDVRVFPLQGAFFVGSSFGRQSLKGVVTEQTPVGPQQGSADLTTLYATPRVGWLWSIGPGFLLGLDAGVQVKLGGEQTIVLPQGATTDMQNQAQKFADLGTTLLPSLHFRVGWVF
jgi:hypothetical protein